VQIAVEEPPGYVPLGYVLVIFFAEVLSKMMSFIAMPNAPLPRP
jgi:hypothetical protein